MKTFSLTTAKIGAIAKRQTAVLPLILQAATLLTILILLLAVVQFATPALAGNDGYYHSKMGYLIRQEGLTPAFNALPHTILNPDAYYDHHLLYHVYLSLFATTDPSVDGGLALTQGAKIASVLLPALAFLAIWWLLHSQKVPYAPLWTIGLLGISEAFLYRMSMPRAQSLSLLLLVLGLHWLLQQKHHWLLPLGFVYVWAYNAFPLLLVMAGIYVAVTFLHEKRLDWQALAYPTLGIGLGLIINPYFPENIAFIYGHLLPKLGESATRVGNEWSPYRTATLLENSGFALAALGLGVVGLAWSDKRASRPTLVALLLALAFGYMLFQSRRFIEYFPPFALIFAALSLAPTLRQWQQQQPALSRWLPLGLALLLIYPLFATLGDARAAMERSKTADRYADAVLWLHDNTPANAMIFQTDWDDFTRLFFYHSDARYTAGLDPTFMELHDPDLFDEWVAITQGKVEQPSRAIRERFGGQYVFSDLNHDDFLDQATVDPQLEELYRDDDAVIFMVHE